MKKIIAGLTLTFSLLAPSSTLVRAQEESPYVPDPSVSDAVEYTLQHQILSPRADRLFHGEEDVSRLEFVLATVDTLYKDENFSGCFHDIASSRPVTFTHLFGDVEKTTWYGQRLCVAIRSGLISGDHDGNFRPFATITAAEASKVLARAYGLLYSSQAEPPPVWYQGPMFVMKKYGAIGAQVKPQAPLSRSDMAEMFSAMRNVARYPETRDIGIAKELPAAASPSSIAQVAATQTTSAVPRSPGSAQMALGPSAPRLTEGKMTTRRLRASAEIRPHEGGVSVIPGSL